MKIVYSLLILCLCIACNHEPLVIPKNPIQNELEKNWSAIKVTDSLSYGCDADYNDIKPGIWYYRDNNTSKLYPDNYGSILAIANGNCHPLLKNTKKDTIELVEDEYIIKKAEILLLGENQIRLNRIGR